LDGHAASGPFLKNRRNLNKAVLTLQPQARSCPSKDGILVQICKTVFFAAVNSAKNPQKY